MTPIERQILKSLKFLITELNNDYRETNLDERMELMGDIDKLLNPKVTKDPCCDMGEEELCECGHIKFEHTEKDKPTRCMYGNGFSCKCKGFVKRGRGE